MSAQTISVFENTRQKSYQWVDDMLNELDWGGDRQDAYHAMRAGLHFVRDRLHPNEVAHLSAQLPMLIRGIYYEGWDPSRKPLPIDSYDDISDYLADKIHRDIPADPMLILRALFAVLYEHISMGELEHIQSMLPATMRVFWPNIVE